MYNNKSIKTYLEDLSQKKPAPGGGSASALTGALGAALVSMVVRFSINKRGCERFQPWLKQVLKKSESARVKLMGLSDEDCRAFLSGDYSKALSIPLKVIDTCLGILALSPDLAKRANRRLVSDVAAAAVLLEAAGRSAAATIEINLAAISDSRRRKMIRAGYMRILRRLARICRMTEVNVGTVIRGKTHS